MPASYHNHTRWSDGADTLAAYIEATSRLGVDELGVSDHYTLTPDGRGVSWSMPLDSLDDYVREVLAATEAAPGAALRLGVEADFFPETVAELRARLAAHPFDYVIGSVHFVDDFPIDEDAAHWDARSPAERDELWRRYWRRVRQLAESRAFDIAAHLDLPKKFGHRPSSDLAAEESAALDAIAAADMAVEINTAGWDKPAREAYPTPALLRAARRRGIPILISADAHAPGELTRHFAAARDLARGAGYGELVRYARRRRFAVPL